MNDDGDQSTLAKNQAARRRRVIDAALELAADGGFDNVQMRDVANAAGVALGTVYRYFASKERLLLEAMAEQQDDLRTYLDAHPAPGATAAERVINVLGRANSSLRKHPDITAAMVRAFGASREENRDLVLRVSEIMGSIITTAIGSNTSRDRRVARILVQVWMSSLIGWVGGVDTAERVDDDVAIAAHLLLDEV
jgi:TetR/AcrR family transcriptional regulator, cholesterol catabolism regulator